MLTAVPGVIGNAATTRSERNLIEALARLESRAVLIVIAMLTWWAP
jgi:hypothetical protein